MKYTKTFEEYQLNEKSNSDFSPTEDTMMLRIDDGHPVYFKKIDSTHFDMINDPKYLKDKPVNAMHIGQLRGDSYYDDVRDWLHNKKKSSELNGKIYDNLNEAKIADKDWSRMLDLVAAGKYGESMAKVLKNKNKAISRFIAGL